MTITSGLRRKVVCGLALTTVGLTAAACSSSSSSSSSGGGAASTSTSTSSAQASGGAIKQGLLVYFIPKDTQNPYEVIAHHGGEKALTALGGKVVVSSGPAATAAAQVPEPGRPGRHQDRVLRLRCHLRKLP